MRGRRPRTSTPCRYHGATLFDSARAATRCARVAGCATTHSTRRQRPWAGFPESNGPKPPPLPSRGCDEGSAGASANTPPEYRAEIFKAGVGHHPIVRWRCSLQHCAHSGYSRSGADGRQRTRAAQRAARVPDAGRSNLGGVGRHEVDVDRERCVETTVGSGTFRVRRADPSAAGLLAGVGDVHGERPIGRRR